jgi:hypothetical protein
MGPVWLSDRSWPMPEPWWRPLLILASGPRAAEAIVSPVISVIGRKTVWLGEAGQGSRMTLVVNAYMSTLIEGVAESLELAERLGIDADRLAESTREVRSTRRSPTPSCTRWSEPIPVLRAASQRGLACPARPVSARDGRG